jgi:GMP synthase PP-ATPase subunit
MSLAELKFTVFYQQRSTQIFLSKVKYVRDSHWYLVYTSLYVGFINRRNTYTTEDQAETKNVTQNNMISPANNKTHNVAKHSIEILKEISDRYKNKKIAEVELYSDVSPPKRV